MIGRIDSALRSRTCGWVFVAVITLGLLARVILGVVVAHEPELFEFQVIGDNLANGRGYSFFASLPDGVRPATVGDPLPSAFRGPGYSVVATGAIRLSDATGADFARVLGAFQVALGVVTLALVYAVVRQLAPRYAAMSATAVAAVHPQLVVLPSLGSPANVDQPALLLVTFAVVRVARAPTGGGVVLLSGAAAVLWLCRPEAPVFVVAAVAAAGLATRRRRVLAEGALALVIAAVVVSAVWLVPRSQAMDRPLLTVTSSGGYNFWFGNAAGASGSQKRPPPFPDEFVSRIEALPPSNDYELAFDSVYRRQALADIADDPLRWIGLLGKKLFLSLTFDPYDDRRTVVAVALATVPVTLGAGIVVGTAHRRRRLPRLVLVPLTIAGAQVALTTAFFVLNRYKLAVDVQLIIATAATIPYFGGILTPPSQRIDSAFM